MDWLLSMGLVYMTARRLAHQSGIYDRALAEIKALGLDRQPSVAEPAPGPDTDQLRHLAHQRLAFIDPVAAPTSWFDADGPPEVDELGFAALAAPGVAETGAPGDGGVDAGRGESRSAEGGLAA